MPRRFKQIVRANKQRGYALLFLMFLLGLAFVSVVIKGLAGSSSQAEKNKKTAAVLSIAKEALIGRAVGDPNHPGSLPCPDTNNDGIAGGENNGLMPGGHCEGGYLGRLPWKTLGLPDLRDGAGERLWYTLSPNFRDSSAQIINSDTLGLLTVENSPTPQNVVAIIFSPGEVLSAQTRSIANSTDPVNLNPANFLENKNVQGGTSRTFIMLSQSHAFNDQMMLVTHEALLPLVERRVANEVASLLKAYFDVNHYYPNAAALGSIDGSCSAGILVGTVPTSLGTCTGQAPVFPPTKEWLVENDWDKVIYYAVAPACIKGGINNCQESGRYLTVGGDAQVQALIVMAGKVLTTVMTECQSPANLRSQNPRSTSNICDYLDSAENTNEDSIYGEPEKLSASSNDQLFIVNGAVNTVPAP